MTVAEAWGQLALDIQLAAHTRAPVLISASVGCAEHVARAIASFGSARYPPDLVVCDCAGGDRVADAIAGAWARGIDLDNATLLLREVHALDGADQAEVARVLCDTGAGWPAGAPRIISTSSVSLFDRVRQGTFDAALFYRLNVMHIVVSEKREAPPGGA